MITTDVFNENIKDYEAWYEEYPEVYYSELEAIKEQFLKLPENLKGIEVGVGTGRFAKPLGIKVGVEPSEEMAVLARKRGIEIVKGTAENIPFKDLQFDFVLFVTICYLYNIKEALREANRVLKPKGSVIIGFIDKHGLIGKMYEEKRKESTFFKHATFYSVDHVKRLLKQAGFKDLHFTETLFGGLNDIKKIQMPEEGYGKGSFVVVKAQKK
jgi:ubiquinone/menaquinone biosynthesis C-methylase UbiE